MEKQPLESENVLLPSPILSGRLALIMVALFVKLRKPLTKEQEAEFVSNQLQRPQADRLDQGVMDAVDKLRQEHPLLIHRKCLCR